MGKTAKLANIFISISVLLSFIPALGLVIGAVTLLVGFVLSIAAMIKDERGGVRVLLSSLLAGPLMVVIQVVVISMLPAV